MTKEKIENYLSRSVKYALFLTALTPIIVARKTISPFAMGKMFFFRTLVELALALTLILIAIKGAAFLKGARENIRHCLKNPLIISLILFFFSVAVSAIFAVNPYRAFWGDFERSEGVFGFAHYLVFFFLVFFLFKKTDWLNFFKIFLISSCVLIFYGFLQYFKIEDFPLAVPIKPRIDSLIGNAAFMAAFLMFTIIFSAIVWKKSGKVWRIIALAIIPLSIISIFLTGTRGAMIGLGAGAIFLLVYFTIYPSPRLSRAFTLVLLLLFVFGSASFLATKNAMFWRKIPGLNRLAEISVKKDITTQTRLIAWKMSWEAFKEKPILGWGPDNYLIAFQAHYNPELGLYGGPWLDRAHNKVFDLLVMQGGLGLITYLGVFIAAFWAIIKSKKEEDFPIPLISAGLIAYFIQNLFVFDQIVSYIPFFALFGYIASDRKEGSEKKEAAISEPRTIKLPNTTLILTAIPAVLFIFYIWHFYAYTPYIQTRAVWEAKKIGDKEGVEKELRMAFFPYNFAQLQIRGQAVDDYYANQVEIFENPFFNSLSDLLTESALEIIRKEPYDVRVFLRAAEIMNIKARNNPDFYEKQEKIARDALKVAPKKQELYYNLVFALDGAGKTSEAIETARAAVNLNRKVPQAHYYLAIALAVAGGEHSEEAKKELETTEALDPTLRAFVGADIQNFMELYLGLGETEKAAELVLRDAIGGTTGRIERRYHEIALRVFAAKQEKDKFIKIAEVLAERVPGAKDGMETLIDLAKKDKWIIIKNLFSGE